MSLFDGIRTKMGEANEALAEAKKSWHDATLTQRETEVTEREERLVEQRRALELELQNLKSGRLKRGIRNGLVTISSALAAFFLGTAVGNQPASHNNTSQHFTADTAGKSASSQSVSDSTAPRSAPETVAACTAKGVAYFKEVGSYPVLHSPPDRGRAAEDVAFERCNRSLLAFGPVD